MGVVFCGPGLATRFGNAGAAKHDDRRFDAAFLQQHFRLEQLKLQADGPQFLATQEIIVVKGQTIGGRAGLGGVGYILGAGTVAA